MRYGATRLAATLMLLVCFTQAVPARGDDNLRTDQSQRSSQQPKVKEGGKDDIDAIGNREIGRGGNWYSLEKEIAMGKEYAHLMPSDAAATISHFLKVGVAGEQRIVAASHATALVAESAVGAVDGRIASSPAGVNPEQAVGGRGCHRQLWWGQEARSVSRNFGTRRDQEGTQTVSSPLTRLS